MRMHRVVAPMRARAWIWVLAAAVALAVAAVTLLLWNTGPGSALDERLSGTRTGNVDSVSDPADSALVLVSPLVQFQRGLARSARLTPVASATPRHPRHLRPVRSIQSVGAGHTPVRGGQQMTNGGDVATHPLPTPRPVSPAPIVAEPGTPPGSIVPTPVAPTVGAGTTGVTIHTPLVDVGLAVSPTPTPSVSPSAAPSAEILDLTVPGVVTGTVDSLQTTVGGVATALSLPLGGG